MKSNLNGSQRLCLMYCCFVTNFYCFIADDNSMFATTALTLSDSMEPHDRDSSTAHKVETQTLLFRLDFVDSHIILDIAESKKNHENYILT